MNLCEVRKCSELHEVSAVKQTERGEVNWIEEK